MCKRRRKNYAIPKNSHAKADYCHVFLTARDLCRSLQISAHGAHTQLLTRPPDYLRLLNQLNAVGFYADPTPPVWAIQPTLLHHYLGSYCATNHDY